MTTRGHQYPPTPGLGDKESATPSKIKLGACDVGRFGVAILRCTLDTYVQEAVCKNREGPWLLNAEEQVETPSQLRTGFEFLVRTSKR